METQGSKFKRNSTCSDIQSRRELQVPSDEKSPIETRRTSQSSFNKSQPSFNDQFHFSQAKIPSIAEIDENQLENLNFSHISNKAENSDAHIQSLDRFSKSFQSLKATRSIVIDECPKQEPAYSTSLEREVNPGAKSSLPSEAFEIQYEDHYFVEFKVEKKSFPVLLDHLKLKYSYYFVSPQKEVVPAEPPIEKLQIEISHLMDPSKILQTNPYVLENIIEEGTFGQVYRAIHSETRAAFCIKKMKMIEGENKDFMYQQFFFEIGLLEELKKFGSSEKERYVRYIDYYFFEQNCYIVFELLGPTLKSFCKKEHSLNKDQIKSVFYDTLTCLRFLHKFDLVHGDIKPENILFTDSFYTRAKVIDFGSALPLSLQQNQPLHTFQYRPPEVHMGLPFDSKVDVWALGVTFFHVVTGFFLFEHRNVFRNLAKGISITRNFQGQILRNALAETSKLNEKCDLSKNSLKKFFKEGVLCEEHGEFFIVYIPKNGGQFEKLLKELKCESELISLLKGCLEFWPESRLSSVRALKSSFFN